MICFYNTAPGEDPEVYPPGGGIWTPYPQKMVVAAQVPGYLYTAPSPPDPTPHEKDCTRLDALTTSNYSHI